MAECWDAFHQLRTNMCRKSHLFEDIRLNFGGGVRYCHGRHKKFNGWWTVDRKVGHVRFGVQHVFPERIPLDGGSVYAIVSEHFFEHLTLDVAQQTMNEGYRLLRAGGRLRIAVPDINHPNLEAGRLKWKDPSRYHPSCYDLNTLSAMLHQAGFYEILPMSWWSHRPEYIHCHPIYKLDPTWEHGWIRRTIANDPRNKENREWGELWSTSLIVDAIK